MCQAEPLRIYLHGSKVWDCKNNNFEVFARVTAFFPSITD